MPAKPIVENRGLYQIPLARTDRKAVEIDENGSTVIGQNDVPDICVAMNNATG